MLKFQLEDYLNTYFPNSCLHTSFLEINTNVYFRIELGLYPLINPVEQAETALNKAIDVFNFIFDIHKPIWILISEWGMSNNDYKGLFYNNTSDNYISWIAYDEYVEKNRVQKFMIKYYSEINIVDLFKAIINAELKIEPMIESRIYFIEPTNNIVFIFWDAVIYIGSNKDENIQPYFNKYHAS